MATPSSVHVEFFVEAVENPALTRKEGRPIFEDKEFIRIKFPGDKNRIMVAPANEKYRRDRATNVWVTFIDDYPDHYKAFKEQREYVGEGTPLSELPFLTESKRAELRALSVYTAEQLAGLDGAFLAKLGMGGRALKTQAENYLAKAHDGAFEARMAEENASLKEQLEALRAQVAGLANPSFPQDHAFDTWDDTTLKNWIGQQAGQKPRGNPNHETLVHMAQELAGEVV